MYTPKDILNFIKEEDLTAVFLSALAQCRQDFTIAEITDREFKEKEGKYRFLSKGCEINVELSDDDVITAVHNGLYVSAFLSRNKAAYQVHFLVHRYPVSMKSQFEEQILNEVIDYMIMMTVVALKLDAPEKVRKYCGLT